MTEVAREEGRGRGRGRGRDRGRGVERERGRKGGREGGRGRGRGRGRELWVFRSFFHFIDRWMGGCVMNTEGFLILLELCTVYFGFQYADVFDPAAWF